LGVWVKGYVIPKGESGGVRYWRSKDGKKREQSGRVTKIKGHFE